MLEIIKEILELLNSGHEVIERIIGFRLIDAVAVIFIVWAVNSVFHLKDKFKEKSTVVLTLLTILVSIIWASATVTEESNILFAKAVFALGFKLAGVSTVIYNVFKPVIKPLINKFYSWLRSKGVEVPEVENE